MEDYIEEVIEEVEQEEEITDTPTEESSAPVPEEILDPQQNEQTENELLLEYIKRELSKNVENEENIEESEESNEVSSLESSQQADQSILSELGAIKNELIYQTAIYDDYNDNNNIHSDINDISLTNTTLILILIGIMFSALLNFSRRIF